MNTLSSLIDLIRDFVGVRLPGHEIRILRQDDHEKLMLPVPPAARIQYGVGSYSKGQAAIIAEVPGQSADAFFWHLPVEDFSSADDQGMADTLIGELDKLIHCPSRVRQKRGWILWRFICEVKGKTRWHPLGGTVTCFQGASVPNAASSETVYDSPALIDAPKTT